MAEIKDTYEALHEHQEAPVKEQLSKLKSSIEGHITSSPLGKLEQAFDGNKNTTFNAGEIMTSLYAGAMAKDIIMDHVTGQKNEKLSFWEKIRQKA